MHMVKGQLGMVAAVVAILLTIGVYLVVSRDGEGKAETLARVRTIRAFHAVRAVLGKDGDTAKAVAQHHARLATAYFTAAEKFEAAAAAEIDRAAEGLGEGWSPDFVGVVSTKRVVVWSRLSAAVTKEGVDPGFVTNRLFAAGFADAVFSGKGPASVGDLPWATELSAPLKGVAVPLFGAERAVVGVVILAWKGRNDDRELRARGEQFRDKLDVLNLLGPRPKLEADLTAMLTATIPEVARKTYGVRTAFVGLLDPQGVLIQRNDRARLFVGQPLVPRSLALQTTRAQRVATSENWLKSAIQDVKAAAERGEELRPEILRVGFAPVTTDRGRFAGVLVVAWELGDVHVSRMRTLSGAQVVYLYRGSLCTSTIKRVAMSVLSSVPRSDLGPGEWKAPALGSLDVQGGRYIAAAAVMPGAGSDAFTFVVMSSLDAARMPFRYAQIMLLILGLCMIVGFLVVGWLLRRYFILPISELERGVGDIVAGNTEHTFGVPSRETEGLAYSLNVLMSQVLGRPEPGDEEEEEGGDGAAASAMRFALGPLPDRPYRPGDSQLIPRLDETRDAHFERLFSAYLEAMQQLGEETSGFDLKTFRNKLEVNERMICARLKCSEVRFALVLGEEGVVFNPYPVA